MSRVGGTLPRLALVGAGHIAEALVRGWTTARPDAAGAIMVADGGSGRANVLADAYAVRSASAADAADGAEVVLLCVRPRDAKAALGELRPVLSSEHTVISVVGGLTLAALGTAVPARTGFVRAMPNLAVAVPGAGTVCFSTEASAGHRQRSLAWLGLAAAAIELDERLLDAATLVAACAPAVLGLVGDAVAMAGIEAGLPPATAQLLAGRMALGFARLVVDSGLAPAEVQRRCTSPGGAVEPGIALLQRADVHAHVQHALATMGDRLRELGQTWQ